MVVGLEHRLFLRSSRGSGWEWNVDPLVSVAWSSCSGPGPDHFGPLAERCIAGDVRIRIDRRFGLDEVPEAMSYLGEGHVLGKAIVEPAGRQDTRGD